MNDELRNHLRGLADGAAARTSDLDTGRLADFVGAARRRRDRQQKVAVGGLALALVGGVTYGGMQILGEDGGEALVATAYSDSPYCQANGYFTTDAGEPADEQLVTVISPEYPDQVIENPNRELARGGRLYATSVDDLSLQLLNTTDEVFNGLDVVVDVYVMDAAGTVMIAAPQQTSAVKPVTVTDLEPGATSSVPIRKPMLCPGQSYDQGQTYTLYAVASAQFPGSEIEEREEWHTTFRATNSKGFAFIDVDIPPEIKFNDGELQMWGGPWTIGPLTGEPSVVEPTPEPSPTHQAIPDPSGPLVGRCEVVNPDDPEDTEELPCPITLSFESAAHTQAMTADELRSSQLRVTAAPDAEGAITGWIRPGAQADITDVSGHSISPDVEWNEDGPWESFTVDELNGQVLNLLSGIQPIDDHPGSMQDGSDYVSPGLAEVIFTTELSLDELGEATDDETLPLWLHQFSRGDHTSSEPAERVLWRITTEPLTVAIHTDDIPEDAHRNPVPEGSIAIRPDCSISEESTGVEIWDGVCPFTVYNTIGSDVTLQQIADAQSWLVLDSARYNFMSITYSEAAVKLTVRNAHGDVVIDTTDMMVPAISHTGILNPENSLRLPVLSSARHLSDLPPGSYSVEYALDFDVMRLEHNPNFAATSRASEISEDDDADQPHRHLLSSTWVSYVTVN